MQRLRIVAPVCALVTALACSGVQAQPMGPGGGRPGGPPGAPHDKRPGPPAGRPVPPAVVVRPAPPPVRPGPPAYVRPGPPVHVRPAPPIHVQPAPVYGPGHRWARGERLPPYWRSRYYVVNDWRGHRLRYPPPGYHWVQSGADYLLVAIATGVIAQVILGR